MILRVTVMFQMSRAVEVGLPPTLLPQLWSMTSKSQTPPTLPPLSRKMVTRLPLLGRRLFKQVLSGITQRMMMTVPLKLMSTSARPGGLKRKTVNPKLGISMIQRRSLYWRQQTFIECFLHLRDHFPIPRRR